MTWEQVHIFLDVVATVGGILVAIIGWLFKNGFNSAKQELVIQLNRLELRIAAYEATCNAERAELFRIVTRVNSRNERD